MKSNKIITKLIVLTAILAVGASSALAADIELTVTGSWSKAYDGSPTVTIPASVEIAGQSTADNTFTVKFGGTTASPVGTLTFTAPSSANLTFGTGTGEINPTSLTMTGGTITYADANVGTTKVITVAGLTVGGTGATVGTSDRLVVKASTELTTGTITTRDLAKADISIATPVATTLVYNGSSRASAITPADIVLATGLSYGGASSVWGPLTIAYASDAAGSNAVTPTDVGEYYILVNLTNDGTNLTKPSNAIILDTKLVITRKELQLHPVNVTRATVTERQYTGTTAATITKVGFLGIEGSTDQAAFDASAALGTEYRVTNAIYTGAGSNGAASPEGSAGYTVTADVELVADGPVAKNYSLPAGAGKLTVTGQKIIRKKLTATVSKSSYSKEYDGSTSAGFSGSPTVTVTATDEITFGWGSNAIALAGFLLADINAVTASNITFAPTVTFADASAGANKNLSLAAANLGGAIGSNYWVTSSTATPLVADPTTLTSRGTITAKKLTFATGTQHTRAYNGTVSTVNFGMAGTGTEGPSISGPNLTLKYAFSSTTEPTATTVVLNGIVSADRSPASGDFTAPASPVAALTSLSAGEVGITFTSGFALGGNKGTNYTIDLPVTIPGGAINGVGATAIEVKQVGSTATIARFGESLRITGRVAPPAADSAIQWSIVDDTAGIATLTQVHISKGNGGLDTVELTATGKGNGTIRVRGKSAVNATYGEVTITISGQRTAPTNFKVLTGIEKGKDNSGQAVLTWTPAAAVNGTIRTHEVQWGSSNWESATGSTHTFTELPLGAKITFRVRASYSDGTSPEAVAIDSVPYVRGTISASQIVFNNSSKTFNSVAQDLGRAQLTSTTLTSNGADLFDTTYKYVNDPTVSTTPAYTSGDPAKYTVAKAPTNAGTYDVTVTFENSRWKGSKTSKLVIAPKNLTNAMLTLQSNLPTYTYDGDPKEPGYDVKDGNNSLVLGTDYEAGTGALPDYVWANNVGAGSARVFVKGKGNYAPSSTAEKTFNIGKRTITIDTTTSENDVVEKDYDGRAEIDTAKTDVRAYFKNLVSGDVLEYFDDYTVTNARFAGGANVSTATTNTVVNAAITLTSSDKAKNYTLASTPAFKTIGKISKKTPRVEIGDTSFTFTIPTNHLYTGTARGIGAVTFKSPMTLNSATDTLTVLYGDTTAIPVDRGAYVVKARVRAGAASNYESAEVQLGEYIIGNPLTPDIVDTLVKSADVRQGDVYRLTVSATSPNAGVLSYQWYRNDTLITGARSATYTVPTTAQGENQYYVWVTNTVRDVQVPDSTQSVTATVKVGPPARSLAGARVDIGDKEYTYNGEAQSPDNIAVTLGNETLTEGVDYVLELTQNTDAGRGLVKVKGIENFKDTAVTSFPIARKKLERDDFTFIDTRVYNAAAQPVVPFATADQETGAARTGLGRATILYNGAAAVPTDAGYYKISIAFARGVNFEASDSAFVEDSAYVISPKLPTASDLNYTIPENHVFNGQPRGIGAVTLKGEKGGDLTVLYYGLDSLPVEAGTYEVTVEVEGGENYLYNVVSLGSYTIADSTSSVASNDRVIPGSKGEQAVVAPVAVVAGEFTVGPNPVAKAAGKAGFFWQGKAIASGTLYVFSTSGNVVAKVKVADKGISTDRREIGSWNLGSVAEGTYLVKGVLVGKDGGKVKVSSLVGVR